MQERIDRQRAVRTDQKRIAVGSRVGDVFGSDAAAGAVAVLDHHGSVEPLADLIADEAPDNVGIAARCERHDQLDRPGRIAGGKRAPRNDQACRGASEDTKQLAA